MLDVNVPQDSPAQGTLSVAPFCYTGSNLAHSLNDLNGKQPI